MKINRVGIHIYINKYIYTILVFGIGIGIEMVSCWVNNISAIREGSHFTIL